MEENINFIKCEESSFKLNLTTEEKSEELNIIISTPDQIYPIVYKKSYSISSLQKISNYFSNFSSIKEIISIINSLITKGKYSLKRDYSNPSNLILALYPTFLEKNEGDIIDVIFVIPLEKKEEDFLKKNLYEIIANLTLEINKLKEKVQKLECDHVSQKQINSADDKIEKINIKLNNINKLNINQDSNFLNRIQVVLNKNILINNDDFNLLKYFINKDNKTNNINFSLIYKASIDSDFSYNFHQKCDNYSPTITIIKSEDGVRFGGYTTQTWNADQECKQDDEAFLFSMNLRKKYEIKKNVECAIYCGGVYGPTFGEGFDLCLCDNFMGVNGSYSIFPKSYGIGSSINELTGHKNFKVLDVEVYSITFT